MPDNTQPDISQQFAARLLEELACPACHGALRLILPIPRIECVSCKRLYPLLDGIPVLISERSMQAGEQ